MSRGKVLAPGCKSSQSGDIAVEGETGVGSEGILGAWKGTYKCPRETTLETAWVLPEVTIDNDSDEGAMMS